LLFTSVLLAQNQVRPVHVPLTVTYNIRPVQRLVILDPHVTFNFDYVGGQLYPRERQTVSYEITATGPPLRLQAQLLTAAPDGSQIWIHALDLSRGSTEGAVLLETRAKDLIRGISQVNETGIFDIWMNVGLQTTAQSGSSVVRLTLGP
jgi:hypothetical protein